MSIKTDCYKEGEKVGKGQVKFELRCKKKKKTNCIQRKKKLLLLTAALIRFIMRCDVST